MQSLADRIVPFDDPRPVVSEGWSPVQSTAADVGALSEMIREVDARLAAIEADFRAVRVRVE
jgi:hypothetical protein